MNDVNATQQLKGMLGMISSSGGSGSGSEGKSKTDNAPSNTSKLTPNDKAPKKCKDRSSKKKIKKKDQTNGPANAISKRENNANASNSKANITKSVKKKKKKKNGVEGQRHSNLHHSQSSNSVAPTSDNKFACSSVFIAPDASNLPIPSFGSIDIDTPEPQARQPPTKKSSHGADIAVPQTVEKLEQQLDAVVINGKDTSKSCNLDDAGKIGVEELGQGISTSRESNLQSSVSGVNLADAATTSNSSTTRAPQISLNANHHIQRSFHQHTEQQAQPSKKLEPSDPLTMLMNPSYGSAANTTSLPSPYQNTMNGNYNLNTNPNMTNLYSNTAITGSQGFLPPYAGNSEYSQHQHQHQLHGQLHHLANPSLPGVLSPQYMPHPHQSQHHFVTLQVQVPATLLPGRQMMVPTPSGYKYSVIVPSDIQAGQSVPVQIPIMHMNAMNANINMAYTKHHQSQEQQHARPTATKKNNEPAPGTWAAKAAGARASGAGRSSSSNGK